MRFNIKLFLYNGPPMKDLSTVLTSPSSIIGAINDNIASSRYIII